MQGWTQWEKLTVAVQVQFYIKKNIFGLTEIQNEKENKYKILICWS